MTKQELMETYTVEQLADKYLRLQERFNRYTEVIKGVVNELPEELKQGTEFHLEIERLQSEVEKYCKAFENAKKERDCQITEYQKKIEELGNRDIADFLPTEPIKIADKIIDLEKDNYFNISDLSQISEHLSTYCKYSGLKEE